MPELPVIPEAITVHIGPPSRSGENISVPFPEYIKNVASSEIYPTWNPEAIKANVYAQISYALNRVYTEYYRSRNYDFDITNSTAIDQSFVPGRDIFENISQLVDEVFNSYIRRQGNVEPLFAQYCNGTTTTCPGLSQWGTQSLSEQGLSAFQILQRYYGDDIEIVENVPVVGISESYPGRSLRFGSTGDDVRAIQLRLNRISTNYPAIPKISEPNGIFGQETEDAVLEFQKIFNLTRDGIVGKATWYKIQFIFNGIKRLNELNSEGLTLEDVSKQFPRVLREGDSGLPVYTIQLFLGYVGYYEESVQAPPFSGYYGPETTASVRSFQQTYGLAVDGIVGRDTYSTLFDVYRSIIDSLPSSEFEGAARPYRGYPMELGEESEDVRYLQEYLNVISERYPAIPRLEVTGVFGPDTRDAVEEYQRIFGITPSGIVGAVTWNSITSKYDEIRLGNMVNENQFSGRTLGE